ncbi:hypothetical protein AB4Z27_27065 [Cupriavidus sp. KB_39]|uniref:hypothetical protein n=1 Tax=Cupriavidus sp. KB_39 TaxID=3233036 RepID=UPI003F8F1827
MEHRASAATSLVAIERAIAEAEGMLDRQQASQAMLEADSAPAAASRALIQTLEETLDWLRAARVDAILAEALARMMRPSDPPNGR